MKGHHYDFRELKNHTTSPVPRARGGRTQMRAAGNPDVFKEADGEEAYAEGDLRAPATRGKRRAARPRSRNERKTLGSMAGVTPKHRADRRARGIQKRADSGYTGPYSGATGYVPVVAIANRSLVEAGGAADTRLHAAVDQRWNRDAGQKGRQFKGRGRHHQRHQNAGWRHTR